MVPAGRGQNLANYNQIPHYKVIYDLNYGSVPPLPFFFKLNRDIMNFNSSVSLLPYNEGLNLPQSIKLERMAVETLSSIEISKLEIMMTAGERIQDCYRVLRKSSANVVGEVIKGPGEFFEWDHYPKGDVYDNETHAQYYYHAHPSETRIDKLGAEHGHFHTFVRPLGMPKGIKPVGLADYKKPKVKNDDICHLIGISMDRHGLPVRLFTVNRWVTGETWYKADDVMKILDKFEIDLAYPSWPVNIWIGALLRLFRPQIDRLIEDRDLAIAGHEGAHPGTNAYEDRALEVTSFVAINVEKQINLVRKELGRRKNG